MVKGIIIGHGNFAAALLKTAVQIVGDQPKIEIVSNMGLSGSLLSEKIRKVIQQNDNQDTIVFVDLPGGSCTISCYGLLKNMKNLNVICGVNLPILLEFFMLREKYTASELVPILIRKGKDNIFKLEQTK
jgi:mannose/fructose-specific phosphotransferase system component IIA